MDEQNGKLDPKAAAWVQDRADRDYGGNFGAAAAAVIEEAYARARYPDDPWAELTVAQQHRASRS